MLMRVYDIVIIIIIPLKDNVWQKVFTNDCKIVQCSTITHEHAFDWQLYSVWFQYLDLNMQETCTS